jgi:glucose/arabinose dehydrogenase
VARRAVLLLVAIASLVVPASAAWAQAPPPTMMDPRLGVRTVTTGLSVPTSLAFLGPNDMLVLEKATGRVQHVVNGQVVGTALDLAVNSASERGLLSIALHPDFADNHWVYLRWTCRAPGPGPDAFTPPQRNCDDNAMLGPDTNVTLAVPLLGNVIDRFVWDPATQTLRFDKHIIALRAFQADGAPDPPGQNDSTQNAAGNHNGGPIRFGRDGKLYTIMGDNGRRGLLQNLPCGPTATECPGDFLHRDTVTPDDQFGGPEPDDAHTTGVILRLNDDGSAPPSNPFFGVATALGGEAGANLKKVFAFGIRNSFGLAIDPVSGDVWEQENGDDTFDELNRMTSGTDGGWVQIAGPASRVPQFRDMETTFGARTLQQLRWPPTNIAETSDEALDRVNSTLAPARYSDPEFSWKWAVPPGGIGFENGDGLGPEFAGNLFVGGATASTVGGHLFRFQLNQQRTGFAFQGPRLDDDVADNVAKNDLTESESLLVGRDFGIVTDIETAPNGNLYVVSNSKGAVYEVFRAS